jgi:hypothetical protein
MKNAVFIMFAILIAACNSNKKVVKNNAGERVEIEAVDDSTEYELIVFDPGYESFLITQPYPKNYYSNEYYKNWNIQYVTEWNYRYDHPDVYGDFYETRIDYDPSIDYGLDFNYRLYQYFQFIDKQYGIVLISRRGKQRTR